MKQIGGSMYNYARPTAIPAPVKHASALMVSYALLVLVGTLTFAVQTDFTESRELFRGLMRATGVTCLAFWILTMNKMAWWFTVAVCSVLSALGIVGIVMLGVVGLAVDDSFLSLALTLVIPTYVLTHTVIILRRRDIRAQFGTAKPNAARHYPRSIRGGRLM
jgi:hypothetical protein